MIFGIKTKKDKKIEDLQKELDRLKFQPPKIIEQPIQYTTILVDMLTQDFIIRGLPIEKTQMDNGDVEYKVRLKVILDDIYRN